MWIFFLVLLLGTAYKGHHSTSIYYAVFPYFPSNICKLPIFICVFSQAFQFLLSINQRFNRCNFRLLLSSKTCKDVIQLTTLHLQFFRLCIHLLHIKSSILSRILSLRYFFAEFSRYIYIYIYITYKSISGYRY